MRTSEASAARLSNGRGDTSVTKKIRVIEERISFRDLAELAWRRQIPFELSQATGKDERTCKRWLAGNNEPPSSAVYAVFGEIIRRLKTRA